ncbi:enoyl-CoA hydratase/isomerase family protein [Sphingomonas flavalba]|uniref:enoyl-CoA hydratase/isomerase family protein n=1 Tax=Sphingomonas flavalba TaxID=2559804 RepID=UPI0039DF672F
MSSPTTEILVEDDGPVRIVTLNRPDRKNALSRAMLDGLAPVLTAARDDAVVRAIVITGAGDAFCAGADVGAVRKLADTADGATHDMPLLTPRHCRVFKPTICAVNGLCASAGLHFVADCDIVIASDRAQFLDTHVDVGQVCAIEPIGLSRRMPLGPILRMVILGRAERLDAQRALELHMVSEVVPHDQLLERALQLAHIAARGSPAAMEASLRAIWDSLEHPLEEAYRRAWIDLVKHRQHPDAVEGPTAFFEKRQPVWSVDKAD